jgi:predicted RNase H-like HicB family nuclease
MFKVKAYPAILEKIKQGYSVFFPDLPGAVSAGKNYEGAIKMATECLSLHLYGMLEDKEFIPEPSLILEVMKNLEKNELVALIYPDIFSVIAQQEDKIIRINITLPQSLLEAIDAKAEQLHMNRSALIQKIAREVI